MSVKLCILSSDGHTSTTGMKSTHQLVHKINEFNKTRKNKAMKGRKDGVILHL